MVSKHELDELIRIAVDAKLEGVDFLSRFTYEQLADGYNGIGPEFLPPLLREKVSEFLHIFKPAAVGHDLRNEFSDGTREGFNAANEEFYRNCLRLADWHYPWYSRDRYRARAAALILYAFVSAEFFGWRAWQEAQKRHAAKMASGNSVWNTTTPKHKETQ